MDKLDKEALKSDYKGIDWLDKEALDVKWFDEYHWYYDGFDDKVEEALTPLQLMQIHLNHAH